MPSKEIKENFYEFIYIPKTEGLYTMVISAFNDKETLIERYSSIEEIKILA